jgi:radical SAM protein with 4Fe4S-binding SPASM domain
MTEFCQHLWNTITVDHRGDVYNCCLIQPAKMGSIYSENLSDLINKPEIIRLRQNSLTGSLPCYSGCNLIDKTKNNSQKYENFPLLCNYAGFRTLYLDFGMKCNISCVMCRQRIRYKTDQTLLNADILIRHIDFTPFENIFLQGGEPLFIDECLKLMAYLAKNGKKYSLLTNGLLINEKMAARLAKEAGIVSISLNAATKTTHEKINYGSTWEQVLANIRCMRKYREKYHSNLSINGRMTITVPSLTEIPLFIQTYQDLGFDTINFGYDRDSVPLFLKDHPKFTAVLSEEIAEVMPATDSSKIDLLRLSQLGLA